MHNQCINNVCAIKYKRIVDVRLVTHRNGWDGRQKNGCNGNGLSGYETVSVRPHL